MRAMFTLLVVALMIGVSACGGVSKGASRSLSQASSGVQANVGSGTAVQTNSASTERYLNDDDHDTGGIKENSGYLDSDDNSARFSYARAASAADARAITTIVKRYYAVAVVGDGQRACSMLPPSLVRAVPLDYGKLGPPYLRGAKTCQAVMALLFKHYRNELSAPVAVTDVLVKEDHAYALLGSIKIPASEIPLQREHGAWEIEALLGSGMP